MFNITIFWISIKVDFKFYLRYSMAIGPKKSPFLSPKVGTVFSPRWPEIGGGRAVNTER